MIQANVKVNKAQLRQLTSRMGYAAGRVRALERRSVNYVAGWLKKEIARDVASHLRINQRTAKKSVVIHMARGRSLSALVQVTGRRIPLEEFPHRDLKRGGVSYAIKRGVRKRVEEAFVLDRYGKERVFKAKKGGGIVALHGPSIPHVVEQHPKYQKRAVKSQIGERLRAAIAMNIEKELAKV